MSQWLLNRLQELSSETLQPQFAFQGAINWLRSLSILTENETEISSKIKNLYEATESRGDCKELDTQVFENIHFAFQNIAALNALNNDVEFKYDICNSAIVCWQDAIVFSAKAMIAAHYEKAYVLEDSKKVNELWQKAIVENELIISPFSLYLPTLIKKEAEGLVKSYRGNNSYSLDFPPRNEAMALGGIYSYLKGTHGYELWKAEDFIKGTDGFKLLEVDNFRKKIAQEYRDSMLSESCVNFLVQAERFRGKSNYRDPIFLTYGENNSELLNQFISDLLSVSRIFLKCAVTYCSKRVEVGTWDSFVEDVEENTCLTVDIEIIEPIS